MRDYLYGTAAVIATALALQYAPVNLSSGNIGIAGEAFIDKALIVTKIKISLSAVIGDKPPRRYELLGGISLLSPEYLLSFERRSFHHTTADKAT